LEEEPVACLITDAVWHFTQLVADSVKIPRIVLSTSSMSCLPVYAALTSLGEKDDFKTSIEEEWAPEFALMTKRDIKKIFNGESEESKLELISNLIKGTKAASGMIVNKRSISWLDIQPNNSVVYVSFGSVAQLGEAEFTNMAWGLANSKQRFLWVIRLGSVSGSESLELLPKGFIEEVGERGCIVKWAPQQEVLAHQAIGAFWTHNGWNSTLESICEGVPMICSPCSYDQPINARHVTDVWKIGVMLDNGINREETESTIKKVIVDKEGNEMRQRSKSLQKKVNLSLKEGGSAQQSLKNLVDYIIHF
nr:UDP-glycosyltransferase 76B1-like [Tanacetum cinerariifolium]